MCEHKNLKTVNDQLFCKDCGQNLPMDFLIKPVREEPENLEAEEILEEKLAEALAEQGDSSEAPQEKQEDGQNPVDSDQTGESAPVKKERKTARKTAKKGE